MVIQWDDGIIANLGIRRDYLVIGHSAEPRANLQEQSRSTGGIDIDHYLIKGPIVAEESTLARITPEYAGAAQSSRRKNTPTAR